MKDQLDTHVAPPPVLEADNLPHRPSNLRIALTAAAAGLALAACAERGSEAQSVPEAGQGGGVVSEESGPESLEELSCPAIEPEFLPDGSLAAHATDPNPDANHYLAIATELDINSGAHGITRFTRFDADGKADVTIPATEMQEIYNNGQAGVTSLIVVAPNELPQEVESQGGVDQFGLEGRASAGKMCSRTLVTLDQTGQRSWAVMPDDSGVGYDTQNPFEPLPELGQANQEPPASDEGGENQPPAGQDELATEEGVHVEPEILDSLDNLDTIDYDFIGYTHDGNYGSVRIQVNLPIESALTPGSDLYNQEVERRKSEAKEAAFAAGVPENAPFDFLDPEGNPLE